MPPASAFGRRAAVLVVFVALVAGCGASSAVTTSSSPAVARVAVVPDPRSGRVGVSMSGYAFHPATVTVTPGTTITFANHDEQPHTATTNHRGFDTGTVNSGAKAAIRLFRPGTYTYYCQFHAFMHGTVIVK